MKRKSLLFLLLAAMFAPLAMNGQTRSELTVANEGGTNYNTYVPIEGLYSDDNFQHTQIIYPASMLTAMQGGQITKLTFYLGNSQGTETLGSTYQLRLGTTNQTEFSSGTVTYLTTVSSSAICSISSFTVSANGTVVFDFSSSPYTYTSGSLVVDVRLTTKASGYNTTYFLGETGSIYYSAHSKDSSSVPTSGTAYSFMPKTTFTYSVSSTPYITLTPASATVITGSTEILTATYGNVSGTPTITYSSSNTSVATVSGSGTTATVTAVAPGTATITATMNGSYTATCAITVEDPSYCTPGTGNYDGSGISNVTFGTNGVVVNNTVGGINYGNYSNLVGAVEAGTTCQVDITYKTGFTYGTIIWVDWNHNYTFEGTEAVYAGQSTNSNPTTLNATFDVPETAQTGDYRMRIIGADMALDSYVTSLSAAADADPCGSYNYSTCHDYTLRVTPASNCKKPTDLVATNVTKNSATLSWIENGEATAWNISVNGNVTPNVTNPYNLTGLTPETSYTVKVCPVCEDERWSDEITFTTLVACPAPTNLTAKQVTNNSAVINWEGNAESYNVRYKKAEADFFDGFDSGIPSSWTKIDADGDGNNWLAISEIPTVYTAYSDLSDWARSGNDAAASASYYNSGYNSGTSLNSNQWLI